MTKRNGFLRPMALGLMALIGLALAGCAAPGAQPSPSGAVSGQPGTTLNDNLSGFLAQAPAGAVLALAESPWGNQVELIAGETYLAASGRNCRTLRVMNSGAGQVTHALACETAQGWEARRLVTEAHARGGHR